MQNRIKQSKKELNIQMVICIGLIVGWLVTIIMCLIASIMISTGENGDEIMIPSSIVIMIVSSFAISIVISKMIQYKKVIFVIIGGCCYLVSLISVNALFYAGMYSGIWHHAFAIIGSTLAAGLIFLATPTRKTKYKVR